MRKISPDTPPSPLAYSYLRFSSLSQAEGDSIRRQTELSAAFAKRVGVTLDTSLKMTDEGVSAFTGSHRDNPDLTALAAFIELVKAGRIPRGSYLIVESLDRLSREEVDEALELLLTLTRHLIRVVQLQPIEMVYQKPVEPMKLVMAIMELSRGHSESVMKSERIGAAWQAKQKRAAEGELLTRIVPAWVKVTGKGKMELIPERAAVVKRIYRLSIEGHGADAITRKLNDDDVPPFSPQEESWRSNAVAWILTTRAAMGEYQPHQERKQERAENSRKPTDERKPRPHAGPPVPNYYPAAVSEKTWLAARGAIELRRRRPTGRLGKTVNIFSGLLKDARDGSSIVVATKAKKRMLVSLWATQAKPGSRYISFPLVPFERQVLEYLKEIDSPSVLPDDQSGEEELALTGELEKVRAQLERVKEQAEENPDVRSLVDGMRRLEAKEAGLTEQLETLRRGAALPMREAWSEYKSLVKIMDEAENPTEVRLRIRAAVQRIVDRVWCVFAGIGKDCRDRVAIVQVWFHGGHHREYGIFYSSPITGAAQREEQVITESFPVDDPWSKANWLDLRDRKQALRFVRIIDASVQDELPAEEADGTKQRYSPWPQLLRRIARAARVKSGKRKKAKGNP